MIDLHTHTNNSDGSKTTRELLEEASEKKLEILSITDHDTIDAYLDIENNNIRDCFKGKIIPGIELKCVYKNIPIEVLGYGIDYKKLQITKIDVVEFERKILSKLLLVANKLKIKYNPKEMYIEKNNPSKHFASFTFASEILKYKENNKIFEKIGKFDENSFYRLHQCNKNSIFFVDEKDMLQDINIIIKNIHNANGLAFLAHGYIYPFEDKDKEIEEILKNTEIDGLECMHSSFSKQEMIKAQKLCNKYHKYKSGGSDYHGINKKDINLATGKSNNLHIEKEFIKDWINKIKCI